MILDTDILIDLKRGQVPAALRWFASLAAYPAVSGFAALEFTFGCQSRVELRDVEKFLRSFPILWPSSADAQLAITYDDLKLTHGFGVMDVLTAALAIRHSEPIATFNVKHFRAIPNLVIVQPYKR